MPKPPKGPRLGSGPSHERLMLSGLAAALIKEERIRTTEAKAKRLRSVADRLITLGKDGSVHARRQALAVVEDRDVVHKLFSDIAPRYSARVGGYTRILKLGPRKGDAAPMALIELVQESGAPKTATEEEAPGRRGVLRRRGRRTKAEGAGPESEEAEAAEADAAEADAAEADAADEAALSAEAVAAEAGTDVSDQTEVAAPAADTADAAAPAPESEGEAAEDQPPEAEGPEADAPEAEAPEGDKPQS